MLIRKVNLIEKYILKACARIINEVNTNGSSNLLLQFNNIKKNVALKTGSSDIQKFISETSYFLKSRGDYVITTELNDTRCVKLFKLIEDYMDLMNPHDDLLLLIMLKFWFGEGSENALKLNIDKLITEKTFGENIVSISDADLLDFNAITNDLAINTLAFYMTENVSDKVANFKKYDRYEDIDYTGYSPGRAIGPNWLYVTYHHLETHAAQIIAEVITNSLVRSKVVSSDMEKMISILLNYKLDNKFADNIKGINGYNAFNSNLIKSHIDNFKNLLNEKELLLAIFFNNYAFKINQFQGFGNYYINSNKIIFNGALNINDVSLLLKLYKNNLILIQSKAGVNLGDSKIFISDQLIIEVDSSLDVFADKVITRNHVLKRNNDKLRFSIDINDNLIDYITSDSYSAETFTYPMISKTMIIREDFNVVNHRDKLIEIIDKLFGVKASTVSIINTKATIKDLLLYYDVELIFNGVNGNLYIIFQGENNSIYRITDWTFYDSLYHYNGVSKNVLAYKIDPSQGLSLSSEINCDGIKHHRQNFSSFKELFKFLDNILNNDNMKSKYVPLIDYKGYIKDTKNDDGTVKTTVSSKIYDLIRLASRVSNRSIDEILKGTELGKKYSWNSKSNKIVDDTKVILDTNVILSILIPIILGKSKYSNARLLPNRGLDITLYKLVNDIIINGNLINTFNNQAVTFDDDKNPLYEHAKSLSIKTVRELLINTVFNVFVEDINHIILTSYNLNERVVINNIASHDEIFTQLSYFIPFDIVKDLPSSEVDNLVKNFCGVDINSSTIDLKLVTIDQQLYKKTFKFEYSLSELLQQLLVLCEIFCNHLGYDFDKLDIKDSQIFKQLKLI